jgi:hypothetical protein
MRRISLGIAFLISLAATIGWIFYMKQETKPLDSGAIVQFEFAKTPQRAQHIIDSLNQLYVNPLIASSNAPRSATVLLRRSIHLDYAFAFLYPLSFVLAILLMGRATQTRSYRQWAQFFACLVIGAGFADIVENNQMMLFLNGDTAAIHPLIACYAAAIKFLILLLALLFLLLCCIPVVVRFVYRIAGG